jgi:hypothetical protein
MKIDKTIKGEKFRFYVSLIPNSMTAAVRQSQAEEPVTGVVSDDFKWIILPEGYMSPYISGVGNVEVKKLKFDRAQQVEAKDYNEK